MQSIQLMFLIHWINKFNQIHLLHLIHQTHSVTTKLFKFFTAFVMKGEEWILHSMSFILGLTLSYVIHGQSYTVYSVLFAIHSWTLLQIAKKHRYKISYRRIAFSLCSIFTLISLPTLMKSKIEFQNIFEMLTLAMKIYSIASRLDKDRRRKLPCIMEYLGYLFCPCITTYTILTTFQEYQLFCSRMVSTLNWSIWFI